MFLKVCLGLFFLQFQLFGDIGLFWWRPNNGTTNFGDELSAKIVEKIIQRPIFETEKKGPKFLALGSILHFASEGDVIWSSGINGKHPASKDYHFTNLDVRAVRGPLTAQFLRDLGIKNVPDIYGDPALLIPFLFPEFKATPIRDYIVIPHLSEERLFRNHPNVVMPSEFWRDVVQTITESRFVISSSLHGIIVAEAFGIPARLLRITENEPLFKYEDYYLGTGRKSFKFAKTIEEALKMGGEPLPEVDLAALLNAFPKELFTAEN